MTSKISNKTKRLLAKADKLRADTQKLLRDIDSITAALRRPNIGTERNGLDDEKEKTKPQI